jgi:hypothetical protein
MVVGITHHWRRKKSDDQKRILGSHFDPIFVEVDPLANLSLAALHAASPKDADPAKGK